MTIRTLPTTTEVISTPNLAASTTTKAVSRFLYIDNIRAFLTIMVLLHHIMIVYAGSGGWIYQEGRQDTVTEVIGSIFCTVNQAYSMGLFMLISAYFLPGAFDRKGAIRFWKDRLVRLGIPLAIYSWVINPLFIYWYLFATQGLRTSFWEFYPRQYFSSGEIIGGGPMWFVEALLIFSLVYTMGRWLLRSSWVAQPSQAPFPSNQRVAIFALLMGLAGFVVRLQFPIGWRFIPLNLQLPFFAQYLALFAAGLLAYRRDWLQNISEAVGLFWLRIAGLVLLMYIPGALLGGALESDMPFRGGWYWQSLYLALWEAFLCVSLCISVLYLFRRFANHQGRLGAYLARNAYGAYIVQMPVITIVVVYMRQIPYHPLLKFTLAGLIAVPLCFVISRLLRHLPYADRVL